MKNLKNIALIITVLLINFQGNQLFAQWQVDQANGFKINLPANWSKSSSMDGTDKIYDYYSPDENAAIQLRVFQAGAGVTTDLLVQVYEESMLPAGTQKQSLKNHTSKNGIPGKQGIYVMNYNGIEVGMAAFYTVQNNKGYVLTAIIPTSMMQQKGNEVRQITQSFTIDGFNPPAASATASKALTPNSSNQNRSGARPSGNTSSGNTQASTNTSTASKYKIEGKYYLKSRSDNKSLTNYHFIDLKSNGTYIEEYSPKNSGNYISNTTGTWKKDSSGRIILYFNDGTESGKYIWEGMELTRWSDNKTMFIFRK